MRALLYRSLGALGGLVFCIASLLLAQAAGLTVSFPAYAGEADFAYREQLFLFGLVPAFLLLGAWAGDVLRRNGREHVWLIAGAALGVAVHFVCWHALLSTLQSLASRRAANTMAILYFLSWIGLPALFARSTRWLLRRRG